VSITCTEDGRPCDTADPDVAEAMGEWRSDGSMTSAPPGSLLLGVRDDGTIGASPSTPGAE
jgi:hypothetical protein